MPPLPVIPDVFRVVLEWNAHGGVSPVNVLHFFADGATSAQVAGVIADHITSDMFSVVGQDFTLDTIAITPLDGSTATTHHSLGVGVAGQATGQAMLNMAACLNFGTTQRGSRGRGRVFLGPITESVNTGENNWDGAQRTDLRNDWAAFITACGTDSPSVVLGVASYAHGDFHIITSLTPDTLLRSCKSRLNQLTR